MNLISVFLSLGILYFSNLAYADGWGWSDFKLEATSPLRDPAKPIAIWGGLTALTFTVFEDQLSDGIENDTYEDKPLGSASIVGDLAGQLVPNVLYAAGMAIHGYYAKDPFSYQKSITMVKATAYASGFTTILKYTVREPRPNSDNRNSFPSGHTTSAAAFAAVVVGEHGWGWAGFSSTALAILTGYSRINDNQHYVHDVVAGAVIGTAYGVGISSLNKRDLDSNTVGKNNSIFLPMIDNETYGIAWTKNY